MRLKNIRFCLAILLLAVSVASPAQSRKRAPSKKARTTRTVKKAAPKKRAATPPPSIKGLQKERDQIKRQIQQQEKRLRSNELDVKKRLKNLMIINTEIADKRKSIDTIRRDIGMLDADIEKLEGQLETLQGQLDDNKQKYVKSMRYMHRNRSIQNQLMFIFSAKNFTQMYRRLRFMREYATYQRVQGEMVKVKQEEVSRKHAELTTAKQEKNSLLNRGERERRNLESKQTEQQQVVSTLQKQQKTIQQIIAQQRKKDAALNAQIDRLIAIEVERARARAAEEARRKAAAEAAAREKERREAERNAGGTTRETAKETPKPKKKSEPAYTVSTEDRRISGNFESNRGRLPMPITGPYRIVSHFGQYNVDGLKNVRLDNKGINIQGQGGAQARSIFDGEVSAVFSFGGMTGVMVRHGSYISVYCNLSSVSVHRGQKVSTRQVLGTVGQDNILQFQLRRETAKLNPEAWLGR